MSIRTPPSRTTFFRRLSAPRFIVFSELILHELKRQGRLANPSAANCDHLVQGLGALALTLVCSHPAGLLRLRHAREDPVEELGQVRCRLGQTYRQQAQNPARPSPWPPPPAWPQQFPAHLSLSSGDRFPIPERAPSFASATQPLDPVLISVDF
ncbi:hypothetical protein MDA_GLEAN10018033 [Myotis davidii]|uniref:Uncharacterized protein n=1 Tax=Myotis davidii TaxID=225400 RepID=L5M2E7_MYODS|nr:hypothetical protein MDA_GLEAN10018033 [Myotis davidii]